LRHATAIFVIATSKRHFASADFERWSSRHREIADCVGAFRQYYYALSREPPALGRC
jgi:hypothetical protein